MSAFVAVKATIPKSLSPLRPIHRDPQFISPAIRRTSDAELAEVIRARFTDAKATLRELFSRIVFNILVGNTDDHARNHAAFLNDKSLCLTPAYDICPQPRGVGEQVELTAVDRQHFWHRPLLNPYALQDYC